MSWPRLFLLAVSVFACAACAGATGAATFPEKPSSDSFVVDQAGLIGAAEKQEIDAIGFALWSAEQIPIVVVTLSSLAAYGAAGWPIEKYAYELFNAWGIGSQRRNYGMLLLVSRDDRRARIELGGAWGHAQNHQAQEVMNTLILPEFRRGNYGAGILAGVRGMDAMARGLGLPRPKQPWWALPAVLGVAVLSIGVIVSLFRNGRSGWGWALVIGIAAVLFFALRAAASARGSGEAFGGGSSGGGGASGSW